MKGNEYVVVAAWLDAAKKNDSRQPTRNFMMCAV
jgi:hypothetical protein